LPGDGADTAAVSSFTPLSFLGAIRGRKVNKRQWKASDLGISMG